MFLNFSFDNSSIDLNAFEQCRTENHKIQIEDMLIKYSNRSPKINQIHNTNIFNIINHRYKTDNK